MNRLLPALLVVLLAGIGVIFWISNPVDPIDPENTTTVVAADVDDPSIAGEGVDPTLEGDAGTSALTRANLESNAGSAQGVAAAAAPGLVHLRLVDRSGDPISGATLTATERKESAFPFDMDISAESNGPAYEASGITDQDGAVSLEVAAGIPLTLEARGEFWAPTTHQVAALSAQEELDLGDLTLTAGDNFLGRVVDPSGKPLAGAKVGLEESGSSMMRGSTVNRKAVSDEAGYFRIGGLPTGKYRVQARSAGYVAAELDPLIIPGTGREIEATLAVSKGREVSGTVVDTDGRAVAGAWVSPPMRFDSLGLNFGSDEERENDGAVGSVPRLEGSVETDNQGHFRLGGLRADDTVLLVNADGYSTARATLPANGEDLLVSLQSRLALSGTLLLPSGAAAAAVEVTVKPVLGEQEQLSFQRAGVSKTTTDADGNFAFRNLSAGAYALSAYKANAQVDAMPVQVFDNIVGMSIDMVSAEHLVVAVTSASGEKLAGAKVKITRGGGGGENDRVEIKIGSDSHSSSETFIGGDESIRGTTDGQGIAILPGVVEGDRRVTVESEGYADVVLDFVRNDGEQELALVMQPAAALRVVVKTASGRSLSGVEVFLTPQFGEGKEVTQKSGLAGRVVWDDLRPGAYQLGYREAEAPMMGMVMIGMGGEDKASDDDHKVSMVELVGRSTLDMDIVVDDMALPKVEVSRNGSPAGGVQVWLESADPTGMMAMMGGMGNERPVISGADGVALLTPKEPGLYTLVARAGKNAPQVRKEVEIHSGEAALRIEVLGAEVSGALFGNSKPITGASLTLKPYQEPSAEGAPRRRVAMSFVVMDGGGGSAMQMDSGNPTDATAVSDSDGVFHFTDVPAGTWVVSSKARGFESWESDPFTVGEGGEMNLGTHQLLMGASISGRNLAAESGNNSGRIDMSSMLRLQDGEGASLEMAMSNPDGTYSFKDLPAGKYKIVRGDYESDVLDLAAGQQLTFDIPKK
jgi:protocatechuate 3,4-dioxygenase beta subunit